ANQDARSIIFRDELDAIARDYEGRARIVHHLDDAEGHPKEDEVSALLRETPDAEAYLCGPGPFMAMVERVLLAAGLPGERLHVARFSLATSPGTATSSTSTSTSTTATSNEVPETIEIHLRGERHVVPYQPGKTLLQTARDAGLDAPYSCEEGFCGCCAAQ